MQGIFRYVLSMLVVLGHLWANFWDGSTGHPGVYAVFGFYLLSGYLMTLTLHRTYAYDLRGIARFFGNRLLRIYPPYLFVLAATLLALAVMPNGVFRINPAIQVPATLDSWLQNIGIFGLGGTFFESTGKPAERLIPPAWSLHVELYFYIAMGLVLGRSRLVANVWLVTAVGYTVYLFATGRAWPVRYSPVAAASLPFSIGAVLYHWREPSVRALRAVAARLARMPPWRSIGETGTLGCFAVVLGTLFVLNALAADRLWGDPMTVGFYASLGLAACLLPCLNALDPARVPRGVARVDRFLGTLSYPVFLCHWLAALLSVSILFDGNAPGGSSLFWSSIFGVNALGWLIHLAVERPVEHLRNAIRPR